MVRGMGGWVGASGTIQLLMWGVEGGRRAGEAQRLVLALGVRGGSRERTNH